MAAGLSAGQPSVMAMAVMLGAVDGVRYSFFVHRTVPRWRLVIPETGLFPEHTTADQWQHSRDRSAADTNPDVRAEVQRQGYCLFAISASFDELDRDLRSLGPADQDQHLDRPNYRSSLP